jgi:uncharacterized membrane protein YhhN
VSAVRRLLPLAVLLSGALAIASALAVVPASLHFVFKPLTTLLIIVHALARDGGSPTVRRWVLTGLVMSLCGDVALMWPQQGFVPGLVSFLLAHLCYLCAFMRATPFVSSWWPFVAYGVIAGFILSRLWPGVPEPLRIPVVTYVGCLALMAAQAAAVWRASIHGPDAGRAAMLAAGGLLFVSSDAVLAVNKFSHAVPLSALWILAIYWAAQWCVASWLKPRVFG